MKYINKKLTIENVTIDKIAKNRITIEANLNEIGNSLYLFNM